MIKTMDLGDFARSEPGTKVVCIYKDISKTQGLQKDIASRVGKEGKKVKQVAYHGFTTREREPTYFLMAELLKNED